MAFNGTTPCRSCACPGTTTSTSSRRSTSASRASWRRWFAPSRNAGRWCARAAIRRWAARGFGPRRASNYYRNIDDYVAAANEALFVMPQIEDIATLDVLDEFLAVPGIDAVAIGPNDLSGTTGHFRQHQHPTNEGAVDTSHRAGEGGRRAGLPWRQLQAGGAARAGGARCARAARDLRPRTPGGGARGRSSQSEAIGLAASSANEPRAAGPVREPRAAGCFAAIIARITSMSFARYPSLQGRSFSSPAGVRASARRSSRLSRRKARGSPLSTS